MNRLPAKVQTVVIGAGAAGLACGLKLAQSHHNFLVLEQSGQPGGMMQTVHRDGFILERGPFNVLVRSPEFAWLLHVLGDKVSLISADKAVGKKRYILHASASAEKNGSATRVLKPVPHSLWSFVRSSALSPWEKARAALGLVVSRRGLADDTIDAIVRRRMGSGVAEKIASAASVGIWGAESHELEAAACLPRLAQFDRQSRSPLWTVYRAGTRQKAASRKGLVSFSVGLGEFADALANELGKRLACAQGVKQIQRIAQGWRITTQSGQDVVGSNIVLACGARQAAELLAAFALEVTERLQAIPHTSLATINFGFRRQDVVHPLDGYGFLVPKRWETSPLLGALFCSAVFPHHAPAGHVLIRAFLGGTRHPESLGLDDQSLCAAALRVLDEVLGLRAEPCLTDVARWDQAIPRYTRGHRERINQILLQIAKLPGLWLAGNFMSGISVNDCITQGVQVAAAISGNSGVRS
jgi:oxygen-dependent protoporphyrinogen oxidase